MNQQHEKKTGVQGPGEKAPTKGIKRKATISSNAPDPVNLEEDIANMLKEVPSDGFNLLPTKIKTTPTFEKDR